MLATPEMPKVKPYMTIDELAEHFGVCDKTVTKWQRRDLLVFIKVGRVVRFHVAASEAKLREFHEI
jgi:excisionase family DNA binding protein